MKRKTVVGIAVVFFSFVSLASARLPGDPWNYDTGQITSTTSFSTTVSVSYAPLGETGVSTSTITTLASGSRLSDGLNETAGCYFFVTGELDDEILAYSQVTESSVRNSTQGLTDGAFDAGVSSIPDHFLYFSNGSSTGSYRFFASRQFKGHVMAGI